MQGATPRYSQLASALDGPQFQSSKGWINNRLKAPLRDRDDNWISLGAVRASPSTTTESNVRRADTRMPARKRRASDRVENKRVQSSTRRKARRCGSAQSGSRQTRVQMSRDRRNPERTTEMFAQPKDRVIGRHQSLAALLIGRNWLAAQ